MDVFKKSENLSVNKGVDLIVVTDPQKVLISETDRVGRYLRSYPNYVKNGYADIIRWLKGILPEKGYESQKDAIEELIAKEMELNTPLYKSFETEQTFAFQKLKDSKFDKFASDLYGHTVQGRFELYPTAYGTMASPFDPLKNTPAFFRLKEFRQLPNMINGKDRTPEETLTHELYAHSLTAIYRTGTIIDDHLNKGTAVNYKERLMDLIGRTLLVRSGLIGRIDVAMQERGVGIDGKVSKVVDTVYYADNTKDENKLRYEGNIGELVGNLVQAININEQI